MVMYMYNIVLGCCLYPSITKNFINFAYFVIHLRILEIHTKSRDKALYQRFTGHWTRGSCIIFFQYSWQKVDKSTFTFYFYECSKFLLLTLKQVSSHFSKIKFAKILNKMKSSHRFLTVRCQLFLFYGIQPTQITKIRTNTKNMHVTLHLSYSVLDAGYIIK